MRLTMFLLKEKYNITSNLYQQYQQVPSLLLFIIVATDNNKDATLKQNLTDAGIEYCWNKQITSTSHKNVIILLHKTENFLNYNQKHGESELIKDMKRMEERFISNKNLTEVISALNFTDFPRDEKSILDKLKEESSHLQKDLIQTSKSSSASIQQSLLSVNTNNNVSTLQNDFIKVDMTEFINEVIGIDEAGKIKNDTIYLIETTSPISSTINDLSSSLNNTGVVCKQFTYGYTSYSLIFKS